MPWDDVLGHDLLIERFRGCVSRNRLASTFLFIGPAGVGKRTFARRLAQALLCQQSDERHLDPCGRCPSCQQVAAESHPDLDWITKPGDKSFIPVEAFIGDREHRMREGMCHRIGLKPFCGGRKVAVIADADYLNQEGANCLLKLLEEPPPKSVLILIGTSEQKQLPTVRSRCQIIRFGSLPTAIVAQLLRRRQIVTDETEAIHLAQLSEGSVQRALEMADPDWLAFRQRWLHLLSDPNIKRRERVQEATNFLDEAGKDTSARRARMRRIMSASCQFYRLLMHLDDETSASGDELLSRAAHTARAWWPGDEELAAACAERCLDAESHVDRNANPTTLLECWLDDLANLLTR